MDQTLLSTTSPVPTPTAVPTVPAAPVDDTQVAQWIKALENNDAYELLKQVADYLKDHPEEHHLAKVWQAARDRFLAEENAELDAYKKDPKAVKTIDEAIYWINRYLENGEWSLAATGCEQVLALHPERSDVKNFLKTATEALKEEQIKLRKNEKAKYREAIQNTMATVKELLRGKKYTEALVLINDALANYPEVKEFDLLRTKVEVEYKKMQTAVAVKVGKTTTETADASSNLPPESDLIRVEVDEMNWGFLKSFFYGFKERIAKILKRNTEQSKIKRSQRLMEEAESLVAIKKEDNVIASELQKNITPKIDMHTLPGFLAWGNTIPMEEIGGDSFNFIQKDINNIVFYIGDAMGHGVRASLIAATVNLILRRAVMGTRTLREILLKINRGVVDKLKVGTFMTMTLFNWDIRERRLSFIGAGHETILHYHADTGDLENISARGIAIGLSPDIRGDQIVEKTISLKNNDVLVLYSDGITEAASPTKELFGVDRLKQSILQNKDLAEARDIYNAILSDVNKHIGGAKRTDDMTLIVLKRDIKQDVLFSDNLTNTKLRRMTLEELSKMSKQQFEQSVKQVSLEQKVKKLLLTLAEYMDREEYETVVTKATEAIRVDKIYNSRLNKILARAKKLLTKKNREKYENEYRHHLRLVQLLYREKEFLEVKSRTIRLINMFLEPSKQRVFQDYLEKAERKILTQRTGVDFEKDALHKLTFVDRLNILLNVPNKKDGAQFINKLAVFIRSGIKIKEALEIIQKQAVKPSVKMMVERMIKNLNNGIFVSETMGEYPRVFSNLHTNLFKSGEESGNLGRILGSLDEEIRETTQMTKKIQGAMIYPAVIMAASIALVIGMLVFVVPKLEGSFRDAGVKLPELTQLIINTSRFISNYWYWLILVVGGLMAAVVAFARTHSGRLFFHQLILKLPVVGVFKQRRNVILFANSMSMLLDSGVLMIDAINITANVVPNLHFKKEIIVMRDRIVAGDTLSIAMGVKAIESKYYELNAYFPLEVAQMVAIGEETGQLADMLHRIAENYNFDLKRIIANFSSVVEPFLMIFIGIMVGIILMGVMLPFFNMGKVIKR